MTQQPDAAVYVAMLGEFPSGVAPTLKLAQQQALAYQTRFQTPGRYEHRWDDRQRPGEIWRLMERRAVQGSRFAWTMRAVHAVPQITSAEETKP